MDVWNFYTRYALLKYHAITGLRCDRQLIDGRVLRRLHTKGQQVRLVGLKFPVSVTWYYKEV